MALKSVIYQDGTNFFNDLGKKNIRHKRGLFILAPSGVGKTHFVRQQTEPHWIDGDDLWQTSNAQPPTDETYWDQGLSTINQVEQRSDVITLEAKSLGFWIIGASNYWVVPDAIVIPEWEVHIGYIKSRENNSYDGGMKSKHLEQLKKHILLMEELSIRSNVPIYKSIEAAAQDLSKGIASL